MGASSTRSLFGCVLGQSRAATARYLGDGLVLLNAILYCRGQKS